MAMAISMAAAAVMGVKQRLERAAGRLLRPWLCQDAQVRVVLSLTRLELLLDSLQLDVQVFNSSSALASSPALLQNASVDRLSLVLAPFSRRPLTLTVEGLHFVFCPRPAGDSHWKGNEEQREHQKRMKTLTRIDPQGAAKHAAAMRLCEQKASSSFYIGFFTELVLCILRLELHKCSSELVTNFKEKMHHRCIVTLNTLILLEGNNKGITFPGGLFAAVFVQIIQSCWKYIHSSAKHGLFLTKLCSAQGLCLQLESKAVSDEIGHSNTAELSSTTHEVLGISGTANDYEASASAPFNETNQILIFEVLQVSLRYDQTCFHGMDFDIPDVILGLDNRDLQIVLVFIAELQGSAVESMDLSLQKQQRRKISPKRSAKELWNLAVKRAIEHTPSHQLFQILQSGCIRRRYAYLYGAWLHEIGWGDQQHASTSSLQDKRKWQHNGVGKFSNAMAEVEKLLPVEAVALARTVARHGIAASTIEGDAPISEIKAPYKATLKDHLAIYGSLTYAMSQIIWKRIMFLFKCCRNRGRDENLDSGNGAPLLNHEIDQQTVTADSLQVFFGIHICRGSLTVACAVVDEVFLEKDPNRSKFSSSQPAIFFSLERFSLSYGTKCNATFLRLISGQVAGSLLSVVPAKFDSEIKEEQLSRVARKHLKFDRWTVRGNDSFTFFSSSCISENVYSGKQIEGLSSNSAFQTSDWISKGLETKQWCGWGMEKQARRDELFMDSTNDPCLSHGFVQVQNSEMPFLVADLQSPNANILETDSRANTISSMLIVGEIVCSITPSLLKDVGSIFCICFKGNGPSTSATRLHPSHEVKSHGHSNAPMEVLWSWGKMCAEKVEKLLSCLVPCSWIFLSALLENPKLRLVAPETTLDNFLQQEKTGTRKAAPGLLKAGMELVLLIDCQRLELSMWPAYATADNPCPQVEFAESKCPSNRGQRLRKAKTAHLAEDGVLNAYSDHKQIGNNLLFSVASVGVMLEIKSINEEVLPLLSPCNILMEASLCRDEFYSLFSASYTLSADVICKISALTVHVYVDEILLILQVFSSYGSILFDLYTIFDISGTGPETSQNRRENLHSEKESQSESADRDFPTQDKCFKYVSEDSLSIPWQLSSYVLVSSISCSLLHVLLGSSRKIINNSSQTVLEQHDSNFCVANVGKGHVESGKPKFTAMPSGSSLEGHAYATKFDMSCTLGDSSFPRIHASVQQARLCVLDQGRLSYSERQALNLQSLMHSDNGKDNFSLSGDFFESRIDQDSVGSILSEAGVDYFSGTVTAIETNPMSAIHKKEDHAGSVEDEYKAKLQTLDCLKLGTYEESSSGFSTKEASTSSSCSWNEKPVIAQCLSSTAGRAEVTSKTTNNVLDINFRLGKVLVTECPSEGLLSMISSMMAGSESLSVHLSIDKGFENVAMGTEGGIMVLHMEALLVVLRFLGMYMQRFAKSVNPLSELSNDTSVHMAEKEQLASHKSTVDLEPFVSLPSTALSNNITGLRRLYSAPPVTQELLHSNIPSEVEPLWRGVVSLKTSSFRLALVKAAASSKTPEGFLMQMSVAANLESLEGTDRIAVNLKKLGICSLQTNASSDVYSGASHGTSVRIPQFGSMSISSGGADKIADSLIQSTPLESAISMTEAGIEKGGNDENNVVEFHDSINSAASPITLSSTSNDSFINHPNCILECLKFTSSLERNSFTNSNLKWSRAWKGSCLLEGMEVALTTLEIQMLLSLMDPLAKYSSTEKPKLDQSSLLTTLKGLGAEIRSVLSEIPDGAIVAVKDAHEHLYISVEENPSVKGHYHLVGVWHYSLAGDKALFKVKYQKTQKNGAIWFSLLSVHAKNAEGEPFRLHFQPGSSLANLVTTNDGSWELWQSVAYKPMEEDLQGLDVNYTKMSSNQVYLINQKSKDSLAFVDGVLMLVRQPGNPFKLKIVANRSQLEMGVLTDPRKGKSSELICLTKEQEAVRETMIPQINCKAKTIAFTVLHSVGYGAHLLPLVRISLEDGKAVIQVGGHKARFFSGCKVHLQYFETQNSCWFPITNPICTDIVYRIHKVFAHDGCKKSPISFICRLKKVDVAVSELSLDTCLFLIGALKLAGPYTLRNSPVLANRCQVENRTGVSVVCRFEHEENDQSGKVLAWQTNYFLIRHVLSRRDCSIQKISSSVTLSLQKPGKGTSTAIQVSLVEPGVVAARTRLQPIKGSRMAPGPILVVDISRKSQDGIFVSISPMVQIHNATGLRLELRCRRPNQGGEGAIVFLEDGDKIDDSMAAFDALDMDGDLRKALASLNLGNYLLSIRPASNISTATSTSYEWSDDVKGSKAVRVSGLFDKLHYKLKTTFKTQGLDSSFETVFCRMKEYKTITQNSSEEVPGKHFIIRSFRRKVPLTNPTTSKQQKSRLSVVAWQEQQEILLLPTIRVQNFLSSSIELMFHQCCKGDKKHKGVLEPSNQCENEIMIPSGGSKACMYANINDLFLGVKHIELGLVSKPLSIRSGDSHLHESDGSMKEVEMDVDFGDSVHFATLKVSRADDGVLEAIVYSKFQLQNLSNMSLVCCSAMKHSRWRGRRQFSNNEELVWQSSGTVTFLSPQSSVSWLDRSSKLLLKRAEENSRVAYLDLDSLSGSLEISLGVDAPDNIVDCIQLGVSLHLPMSSDSNPTHILEFAPRYIIVNDSSEPICICQNGFQDSQAIKVLDPGERTALHAQALPGSIAGASSAAVKPGGMSDVGQIAATGSLFSVRFCLHQRKLDWSGPVCAAALGSFYIKMRSTNHRLHHNVSKDLDRAASTSMLEKQLLQFAVADVQEEASSLIMRFRLLEPENMPYQIQNRLKSASILFHQKGLTESEVLESGATVAYVWDDQELPHRLVVAVTGTRLCLDLNIDKIRPWKSFFAVRNKNSSLLFQLQEQFGSFSLLRNDANDAFSSNSLQNIGYEVYADGPTRILRICENADCIQTNHWMSEFTIPRMKLEMRLPLLAISIVEPEKQKVDAPEATSLTNHGVSYLPVICAMITALSFEAVLTTEYSMSQLKVQRFEIDFKWQGAPFAALLRIHEQDRFSKAQTVLKIACVISNRAANPLQVKYASMLLQAIDLNLDEETLMKLAPFYRRSLADMSIPSRQIYFERFEIHPIKIFASFLPGQLQTDYTSTQETLRALLHSVIKVPSVRGAQIQLNGVLLSNALLTFRQLAVKCAQHYSWYAMRAIYIARGSKLLPPAFASLFDDSAASSLDVFFDPSNGSVDIQGLTLGMFNLLSKAIRNKGHGGTSRYFGDLESTVRKAGSNLMFAVVTEVSDNILKGAETGGFDGMVNGFRRGILNVAMEPSVLHTAVVKGGSTRRIHLQRSVGINEAYIEGYLQAILDTLFKQEYLKVKVVDDQVILKNLPPNSMLMEEIMISVQSFLIGEGLLVGDSSISASHSLRRLDGTKERRLVPAITALCEQLFIIFVIRGLRQQTRRLFHLQNGSGSVKQSESISKKAKQPETTDIHTSKLEPEKAPATGEYKTGYKHVFGNFIISSFVAYIDGRLCRHIPNPLVRRIVSGFLLSFVE